MTPVRDFSSCAPLETDRPSSPYQLEEPSSPTNPLLTSRVALQAPPSESKSAGSSSRFLFQDRAPFLPAAPGMPLQDSVRSLKSKPRDAFRRALPDTKTLSSARISIAACFSGRIACLRLRTVSPWPISHVASTRDVSFTLAETFAWETGTFRFAFPANAAMRAADECHPLPDQLHPCSPFFRFSS